MQPCEYLGDGNNSTRGTVQGKVKDMLRVDFLPERRQQFLKLQIHSVVRI